MTNTNFRLNVPLDMANLNKIIQVNDPTNTYDVATKHYVDTTPIN